MTTLNDAYEAGVDAVIADNTINQNGFEDAIRALVTTLSGPDADAWVSELIVEYNRLDLINNPTWASFRSNIISDGKALAMDLFASLETAINALATTPTVIDDIRLMDLRIERDNIDEAILEMTALIQAQPNTVVGNLVKDALRVGREYLRVRKQEVRDEIQRITGDANSTRIN